MLRNAEALTGKSLAQVAKTLGIFVPENQKRAKGWSGELLEKALGATAASLPEPDFQQIGIELKTIPINKNGYPKESTYLCMVALLGLTGKQWQDSLAYKKLQRVLWVPIEADPSIILARRRIGHPFIWSPDPKQELLLRDDWEEFMDLISLGKLDQISSRHGKVLQIRPKGANSKALVRSFKENGETGLTLPRGFYLRATFTNELLIRHS